MRYAAFSALLIALCSVASAADWLVLPSTYSHDPETGKRVSQYSPIQPPTAPGVSNFRSSGYTHTRSTLNYGQSADNYHRVERWGDQVRPYGEWRFPYRPYSTPYPNWGTPYAGLNLGFGYGYGAPYGTGYNQRFGPAGGHPGGPSQPGDPGDPNQQPGQSDWRRHRDFDRWPLDRRLGSPGPSSPGNPYPAGPGSPYPVAPYYDGYYPNYRD